MKFGSIYSSLSFLLPYLSVIEFLSFHIVFLNCISWISFRNWLSAIHLFCRAFCITLLLEFASDKGALPRWPWRASAKCETLSQSLPEALSLWAAVFLVIYSFFSPKMQVWAEQETFCWGFLTFCLCENILVIHMGHLHARNLHLWFIQGQDKNENDSMFWCHSIVEADILCTMFKPKLYECAGCKPKIQTTSFPVTHFWLTYLLLFHFVWTALLPEHKFPNVERIISYQSPHSLQWVVADFKLLSTVYNFQIPGKACLGLVYYVTVLLGQVEELCRCNVKKRQFYDSPNLTCHSSLEVTE